MNNLEKDIEEVKKVINDGLNNQNNCILEKPFNTYSKTYFCTNENIKEYLKLINFNNSTNALSVLSSGDHVFNLLTLGIKDIDTFDINVISLYFALGLKRAMILKYNYEEYIEIVNKIISSNISLEETMEIINSLLPFMDSNFRLFWISIGDYNYKLQKNSKQYINLFHLLTRNYLGFKRSIRGNIYLENIENYNKLKESLLSVNINFYEKDLLSLSIKKKFDVVVLSNILTYFEKQYNKVFTKETELQFISNISNMVKKDGIIFLNYLFEHEAFKQMDNILELKEMDLEYIPIKSISYLYDEDGVVLKRIK